MKILFCSSEVTPYAKTGGLADVSSALPAELNRQGIDCEVIMPLYGSVRSMDLPLEHVTDLSFLCGSGMLHAQIFRYGIVNFIENTLFFKRDGVYTYAGDDYPDNLERFSFFSRACAEYLLHRRDIDIIHCNDWQTALVPAYIRELGIEDISSLFTIHNLAYQGSYHPSLWNILMLPRDYYSPEYLEFFGRINVLKAGLIFSDGVNTVSPTYAHEIQTQEFGAGLDGLLRSISFKLSGITNGIDIEVWNPSSDPLITRQFSITDPSGKEDCKTHLQNLFDLTPGNKPLFGMIGRLVEQKGIDLVLSSARDMVNLGCQIVILGNGDPAYEKKLAAITRVYRDNIGSHIGFDETLAHAIEAGSDYFLMPSRFEPCGLNQMISMRYGTIPIVTAVGGLKDTVVAYQEGEHPWGLRVKRPTTEDLLTTVRTAHTLFTSRTDVLRQLRINAMAQDVSWTSSAQRYAELYTNLKDFKERTR
ncbi:MAG: glycogen synthase GlgA [Desulfomonilia bacterium]|nr:glycogen synthase GlgA [Desulfomonilia bacterium]